MTTIMKSGKSILFSLLLATVMVVKGPPSVAEEAVEAAPIKIGALMPLTGEFAMAATAFREGLELAEDEINEKGGIARRRLQVVIEDTQSNPRLINTAALKLINFDKVVAGITTSYPETEVGGAQFQRAEIPSLALWDSSPEIDAMGEYIFAIGPWTPSDAQVGARFCKDALRARRIVVVNTVEAWSELVSNLFEKEFTALGGEIVGRFKQNPGDSDFRAMLTRVSALRPDAIYAPLASEVIPFHQQLRALQLAKPVVSAGVISNEHIAQAPQALEGVYQSQISDPKRPQTKELAGRYERKFGRPMGMAWYVATGFDALRLYAHAMVQAGPNPREIKKHMYTIKNFPGATRDISIGSGGSSPYYVKMFQIRSGIFEEVN